MMRRLRSHYTGLALFSATLALLALNDLACGGTDVSMFEGSGQQDGGGGPGFGDPDGGAGGPDSGHVNPVDETCGGKPCANNDGPKDFLEPDVPANAPALFDGANANANGTNPAREPGIVYPSHETMFPINVSHIHHEWIAGGTNDLFRLRFEGPKTTVTVYTNKTSWEPTEDQWDWIAESNRGGSVTLTVTGLNTAAPQQAWQSKGISLLYSAAEVEGALYYWSTGSAGIMKALVSDRLPEKFYTDPKATDANTCVACHTLSRDGKRLAVNYGGEKLKEVSVPARAAIVPATGAPTREGGWSTFSPDGKQLLVASKGILTLIDSDTGAPIGANNGVVPLGGKLATHPDWSALGDKVVVSLATKVGNKDVEGGAIAIIPYSAGTWGAPQVIVPAAGAKDNNFFPVFSPDSKWIAYVNAQDSSKDEVTAVLKLVPASGGTPIEMPRLNRRVNNADGVMKVGDSMPTWAPSTKPGVFWLAFSSVRAYAGLRPATDKLDQIWIAAVDPTKADPGYAAFWAPFQSMPEGNHRAFWTHVEGEKQCRCAEICGDGIDNNCNGVADEADCQTCQAEEICGNGKDDNCDCVVDNCGSTDPDPVVK
jgi:Tol biopolymer transport system component